MRTLALGRFVLRGSVQMARRERGVRAKQRVVEAVNDREEWLPPAIMAEAEKWKALAARYVLLTFIIMSPF